jgi:hypothetical protein
VTLLSGWSHRGRWARSVHRPGHLYLTCFWRLLEC